MGPLALAGSYLFSGWHPLIYRGPYLHSQMRSTAAGTYGLVSYSGVLGSLDNPASFWRSLLKNSEPQPGPHPDHRPPSIPASALSRAGASPLAPVVTSLLHKKYPKTLIPAPCPLLEHLELLFSLAVVNKK